jgi:cytochrome P450
MALLTEPPLQPTTHATKTWPEERGHRLLGCLRLLQNDPLSLYAAVGRKHGGYVKVRALPGFPFYVLSDPDGIDHVLYRNHKNYRKPDVFNGPMSLLAGRGVLTSEGPLWLRQRKLMQPAFLKHNLARQGGAIADGLDALLAAWATDQEVDVVAAMMRLALAVGSRALFSTDISGDADAIGPAYRHAFAFVSARMNGRPGLPLWVPTPGNRRFRAAKRLLDGVVLGLIAARRRAGDHPGDVLDLLLAAQDEESGQGMTDEQLKDEVITLLTAGHETIGAALSWAWYLLGQHPQIQRDLHDEAAGRLQGRLPTPDDLPHLPLATAVFLEAMRLYPPAWGLPRETIGPDAINGYPLPPKAILTISQWIVHRRPDLWPDPERFDPARFLPGAPPRHRLAYFPFGGGPRVCIGNHLALMEGPLLLAGLAQHRRLELVPGQTVVPDATFTLRPRDPVRMIVRRAQ